MIRPVHTPIGRASTACIVFSFLVLFTPDVTPAPTPLGQLIQTIRSEVKAEEAMNFMRQVYSTDRWFTFPKFHETAEYVKQSMKGIGLEEVELSGAPADGSSQSGFWTMPLAWDVKAARLEIVDPPLPIIGTSLHWQTISEFRHRLECGVGQRLQKGSRRRS